MTRNNGIGRILAETLAEDTELVETVRGLIDGSIRWNDIQDEPGIDVETGNPIPDGRTEA